jgi:hypothetical protein
MTVHYQLQPEDFHAFTAERQRFMPRGPAHLFYWGIQPALCIGLALVVDSFTAALSFTLLNTLAARAVQAYAERRYFRIAYNEQNLAAQLLPRQVTLAEEGVTFSSEVGVSTFRWRFIREVVRRGDYVHIVLTPLDQYHVPVRAFADEEEIARFVSMAQGYLSRELMES